LGVEQNVLFQAVQAYMNVIRDRQILSLRRKNVSFLQTQLRAANERFKVGEITRTDVSQARASLSQGQAAVAQANANVASSMANYLKIIGKMPGNLKFPQNARLPSSLDAAQAQAAEISPNILAAAYAELAATYNIDVIKGELLPEVSLQASAQAIDDPSEQAEWTRGGKIEGLLTVPLYEGGRVYSQVRQAKQQASQRKIQVIEQGRTVREAVTNAWSFYLAAGRTIQADRAQVDAAKLALDGVQQEYLVGSRTTLDVLNAQSVLINARIALVGAQRDQIVAGYQVLGAVGKLTARHLKLRVDYYDPQENYNAVRNKWIGLDANTVE
jgi:outer membrane protein